MSYTCICYKYSDRVVEYLVVLLPVELCYQVTARILTVNGEVLRLLIT